MACGILLTRFELQLNSSLGTLLWSHGPDAALFVNEGTTAALH